ncbi:MAG: LysR substrate-binding domain-containing protein [Pseudomonadota bacterium]
MDRFTLKQLRYFEVLANFGHFGRAADACSVSQPALSVQIKQLENSLGVKLFERNARQVRLTQFGQTFAEQTREILRAIDDLDHLARASNEQWVGRLRLGIIPTIAPYLLPTVLKNITRQFPEIDVQVRETQTQKLIEDLSRGNLDTAIVALPVSETAFTEIALFEESFLLVRPKKDHGKPVPNSENLREMRLLLLEEGHCFRDQALSFCNIHTKKPREMMEGSSLATLVQMVSVGIGVTLIPEMAEAVETRSGSVSVAHFPEPKPTRTIGMIWRNSSPLDNQLMELAQIVRQSALNKI